MGPKKMKGGGRHFLSVHKPHAAIFQLASLTYQLTIEHPSLTYQLTIEHPSLTYQLTVEHPSLTHQLIFQLASLRLIP